MSKTRSESTAKAIATERTLYYGLCAFDGWYYVGTVAQLERIGVFGIRHWSAQ